MLSREKKLTDLVDSIADFKQLFKLNKSSIAFNSFLQESLIENEMTKSITAFFMDQGTEFLIFGS